MSLPIASLGGLLHLAYFCWLDITGDPVRATTLPGGYTFGASETGDPDLDGHSFIYIPNELVEVGDATHSQAGSDSLDLTLSGLTGPNDTLLATLSARANWQGRIGRQWHALYSGASITYISETYTGYMMQAPLRGDPDGGGQVTMTLENYLALLTTARARTYQDQAEHDSGDLSAARIRASANGATSAGVLGVTVGGASLASGQATNRGSFAQY